MWGILKIKHLGYFMTKSAFKITLRWLYTLGFFIEERTDWWDKKSINYLNNSSLFGWIWKRIYDWKGILALNTNDLTEAYAQHRLEIAVFNELLNREVNYKQKVYTKYYHIIGIALKPTRFSWTSKWKIRSFHSFHSVLNGLTETIIRFLWYSQEFVKT